MQEAHIQHSTDETDDENEEHPQPRGALVIMLSYLLLLTVLWLNVYLQMINSGGIQP
ncbi:MAG: hypothetical protein SH847_25280 [Roseiflexaceae bacterium]|mgnify:CR=1 FL=1|nr:hypothetical protein [Roseiflexaceae bacterium]